MHTTKSLTWAPPRSLLRIEYSTELLFEVLRASDARDARGLLFGMRNGNYVWILATYRLRGAAPVGVFVVRCRGEVFLTESDLDFLEEQKADLALVVVGAKGGFFIRERNGCIQAIQSYEEFPLPGAPAFTGGGVSQPSTGRHVINLRRWAFSHRLGNLLTGGPTDDA